MPANCPVTNSPSDASRFENPTFFFATFVLHLFESLFLAVILPRMAQRGKARQSRNPNNSTTDFTDFTDKKNPFPIREICEIRGKKSSRK
jgi:hypothetical protein